MNEVKHTVLVVDDSGLSLRTIKTALEDKYEVKIAVSGKLALKIIPDFRPEVILLDYVMPEMNGAETFDEIRKLPESNTTPVIFLTSIEDSSIIEEIMQRKPFGYILKPPNLVKLRETIDEALGIYG